MKFLCVECDSSMALTETKGPENGSMTVVFTCRACERQIAMLTNSQETQMVHSLGVKIGGRKEAAAPMETIRESLIGATGDGSNASSEAAAGVSSPEATANSSGSSEEDSEEGGKCPFSSMVAEGMSAQPAEDDGVQWTPEAEERLQRIPGFVRSMVKGRIEEGAKEQGIKTIDAEVMASMRGMMGM